MLIKYGIVIPQLNHHHFIKSIRQIRKKYQFTLLKTIPNLTSRHFHITKQPTRAGSVEINIGCFAILTDVGVEMYSLLKDEIENYPTDYLEAIIKDEQYKNFGLVYEITA